MMKLHASWHAELKDEIAKPYIGELKAFLSREKEGGVKVFPPEELVFSAFSYTPFSEVKVVIIGQDPYHGDNQAHGLCFSVPPGMPAPPSLKNIFKELKEDLSIPEPPHGTLTSWAKQGVLLLNATLTVRAGQPLSHHGKGWERFTDAVVAALLKREDPLIFVLWGKSAREKVGHIAQNQKVSHEILTAPHPSPLSAYAGFFGSRPFSKVNAILEKWGKAPIKWQIN